MSTFTALEKLEGAAGQQEVSVVALVATHNRVSITLKGLESLDKAFHQNVRVAVVIYDAESSDGTAEAVEMAHPSVTVIRGSGDKFWSASMADAQEHALNIVHPDYLLWFNDDVLLLENAFDTLLSASRETGGDNIVVGPLRDYSSHTITYSGYRRIGPRPQSLTHVHPSGSAQPVATFNGNVVLVSRVVYEAIGSLDKSYGHAYGDVDYGYRAGSAGFESWVAGTSVGYCSRNSSEDTWLDVRLGLRERIKLLFSHKGIPLRAEYRFLRRHGGAMWFVTLVGKYVKCLLRILLSSLLDRMRVLPTG